jgi:uncharacterized protein DUF4430/hemolysin type calcium-binding protein
MQIVVSRPGRRAALAAACALVAVLVTPTAASAATDAVAKLHVEAGSKVLDAGAGFVADTGHVQTAHTQSCNGSGHEATLSGPTALGALVTAERWRSGLRPLAVSDEFNFGLFVCGIGGFNGSDQAFWLYKVNHVSPEVGADAFRVKNGDDVLWYFQNTATGENTGDELAVRVPARAKPGVPVDVKVLAFSFDGSRSAAAGATVIWKGGGQTTADADGNARITFDRAGYPWVRAGRGQDISSSLVKVCVNEDLHRCAPRRGLRIFGTEEADRIVGTAGRDVVSSGSGDDVVNVRGARFDKVRCGDGHDLVRADRNDRAASDCEEVRRK